MIPLGVKSMHLNASNDTRFPRLVSDGCGVKATEWREGRK